MDQHKIKFYIKEYFTFTKGERIGIISLLTIILLIIAITIALPYIVVPNNHFDVSRFENEILNYEKAFDSINNKKQQKYLPDTFRSNVKAKTVKSFNKIVPLVEVNTTDSASLERLPCIGPVLARRIVKYRTLLGGYYSLAQLNEVYGVTQDIVNKIIGYLTIDTSKIRKIEINSAEFKEINSHPYISFEQTKVLFKYRRLNRIQNINQLKDNGIFTDEEVNKLKYYIVFCK